MAFLKEDGNLNKDNQFTNQTKNQILESSKKLNLQDLLKKGAVRLKDVIAEIERDLK